MIVKGIVEVGLKIGTTEFVPTMNLLLEASPVDLKYGVYACKALVQDKWMNGVMHYGPRSSVDDLVTFEVNLFDFDKKVYGEAVEVEVLDFIRPIQKFDSYSDLKFQIQNDVKKAREILNI